MALRNILQIGDPTLRSKCYDVVTFNNHLGELLDDMKETMFAADGVGLAGPQVGILRRICVVCVDGKTMYELINPVIVSKSGKQKVIEGCLSIPNRHGYVERPKTVVVRASDRFGKEHEYKAEGLTAVAFCHEIDHLDGNLFIDKITEEVE